MTTDTAAATNDPQALTLENVERTSMSCALF